MQMTGVALGAGDQPGAVLAIAIVVLLTEALQATGWTTIANRCKRQQNVELDEIKSKMSSIKRESVQYDSPGTYSTYAKLTRQLSALQRRHDEIVLEEESKSQSSTSSGHYAMFLRLGPYAKFIIYGFLAVFYSYKTASASLFEMPLFSPSAGSIWSTLSQFSPLRMFNGSIGVPVWTVACYRLARACVHR